MPNDKQEVIHNRYIMYTETDRSKGYRLDISNYGGKRVVFRVNGRITTAPEEVCTALLQADSAMQTAVGEFMIASNAREQPPELPPPRPGVTREHGL